MLNKNFQIYKFLFTKAIFFHRKHIVWKSQVKCLKANKLHVRGFILYFLIGIFNGFINQNSKVLNRLLQCEQVTFLKHI